MARWPRFGKPGRVLRLLYRIPMGLYAMGGGALLGHRFLMVVHRGRKSGRLYRTVLEVVRYDPATQESVVAAGYGPRADWFRNLQAAPAVEVQIGRQRFVPAQRRLSREEAAAEYADYERRHPRLARLFPLLFGISYDGSPAARLALADRIPMMAFRPRALAHDH
jgi:deazaflavin-dependent oxidoreductase (nitroreductase family)